MPPTSLKPMSDFFNRAFAARRRASYGSLVRIALKRMDNGHLYSVATFDRLGDFSGPKLAKIKEYALGFKENLKAMFSAQANDAKASVAEAAYDAAVSEPAALNQEVEDLPFGEPEDLPFEKAAYSKPTITHVDSVQAAPVQISNETQFEISTAEVINGDKQALPA